MLNTVSQKGTIDDVSAVLPFAGRKSRANRWLPTAMFNPKRIAHQIRSRIDSGNRGIHLERLFSGDALPDS